ncbi:ammonium transporter Rh type B isoform X5 [Lagenorhynchus albirostris]|uniref:ammonium transporter Rh type B isoform X5 n=1 Tax=Lagenorhynchus albirostris TaxID=27610 RepID=UPI0028EED575|nr:ammonium transporter Rh type B isoform X5 [Lagenorhynchus albirostris]
MKPTLPSGTGTTTVTRTMNFTFATQVHIQNAALAGGVVVGTSAEMMLTPFGALVAGFLAGTVSTLGYKFFTPTLESKLKVQDTCGVHNLHGMPGVLGALLGVLVAGLATHEAYGDGLESVFPLLAKGQRSATSQAMHQLFGLFVTLIFASVGGSLGGLLLRLPFLDSPPDSQCYEDQVYWEDICRWSPEEVGPEMPALKGALSLSLAWISGALWACSGWSLEGPWAGPKQTHPGSEAERGSGLCCAGASAGFLSSLFPPCSSWQGSPQLEQMPPPTLVSPPPQLSSIHLRLPRARNVAPGHCGACSQSPSSSFHLGLYRRAFIPQAAVWVLALTAQTEISPPPCNSSRFILPQHHLRRLRCGGSRSPGVGAGGGSVPLLPSPPATQLASAGPYSCTVSASYAQGLQAIHPLTSIPVRAPQASIIGGISTGLLVGSC